MHDSTLDPKGLNIGRVQCEYSQVVYESRGRGGGIRSVCSRGGLTTDSVN